MKGKLFDYFLGAATRGSNIIDNPELQIFREQEQLNPEQISNIHLNPAAHFDVLKKANSGIEFQTKDSYTESSYFIHLFC